MTMLEELRTRGATIENNVIFLGYDESADYDEKRGRFRVRWLIGGKLYYVDALADELRFTKAADWNWADHEHPNPPVITEDE